MQIENSIHDYDEAVVKCDPNRDDRTHHQEQIPVKEAHLDNVRES